jgi:dTDP-4-dehydrorhamnose reductase
MPRQAQRPSPEIWAGIECTVNRVGDRYTDQLQLTGHADRLSDLDLIAGLGVKAVRYPVLWERTAPGRVEDADWSWPDERLNRLRELRIEPIVTLVHHGSGPPDTSLLDDAWPERLAAFAGAVSRRYPWVRMYTPVNEPLTTARFSALYGHWYPHLADSASFVKALMVQCKAIVLSMQAIRQANPGALLVQTEDVGKTFSTPRLAYQARFQDTRRWLGFDLLCGMVDQEHPLWRHLLHLGVEPADLEWFMRHACPPDCIGVNHYLSSDRFLDHRVNRYPAHLHGGNGREIYADVEAARVDLGDQPAGPYLALRETWERYGIPLAVTEAHNGCTREEQIRWLMEVYNAACKLSREGADVRAFTAWSVFGAFDWNTLVTQDNGFYEPGLFDIRGPEPRPTAAARLVSQLAAGETPGDPTLESPGWWQRPERILYPRFVHRQARAAIA